MAPARWSQINAARSRRQRSKCARECHHTPGHLAVARTAIWAQAPSRPSGRARARSERSAEPCAVPSTDRASIAGWPVARRWFRSSSSRVRGSGHRCSARARPGSTTTFGPEPRPERVAVRGQIFPHERGQIVRRIGFRSVRNVSMIRERPRLEHGRSTPDTDSHGVSDPPDRRGTIASARTRVAHAMISSSDSDSGTRPGAAKSAAHMERRRRVLRRKTPHRTNCGRRRASAARALCRSGLGSRKCDPGDNLVSRGRPPGRPLLLVSGDVNQGREMQVLAGQFDALDPAFAAVDGVGDDGRAGHPEGVRRLLQPLAVEGPIARCAEGT